MLHIDDISYSIQGRPLFAGASASVPEGHKVGLVGPNGAGKTTLFKLIRGELGLDGGAISLPTRARIGGVAQESPRPRCPCWRPSWSRPGTHRPDGGIADRDGRARIADIQTRLTDIDAWSAEARAATILDGLGFDTADQQRRPATSAAAGGCAWRWRGCCSRSPTCCFWTNRPTIGPGRRAVAGDLSGPLSAHGHHHQPRPRAAEPRRRPYPACRGQEADAVYRRL